MLESITGLLILLFIALASQRMGHALSRVRLPLITGFLVAGVVAGPQLLGLINAETLRALRWVDDISLAFIAFAAGAELHFEALRSRLRPIRWITGMQVVVTYALGLATFMLAADLVPFVRDLEPSGRFAVGLLAATVLVARSPSSAIAVINEMRASGPFTRTVLGVTVASDVAVVMLFALSASVAGALLHGGGFDLSVPLIVLGEIVLAVFLGMGLGRLLGVIFRFRVPWLVKSAWVLGLGLGLFQGAKWVQHTSAEWLGFELFLEPLLICMVAGFSVSNLGPYRAEFSRTIDLTGPGIYVLFFTMAGAGVALDVVASSWQVALVLVAVRLLGIFIGSWIGGTVAGEPPHQNRYSWLSYVTQAGIGLGLAREVASEFPEWGQDFATLMIAVIVVNQVVGPPLFKLALQRSGEARLRAGKRDLRGTPTALIFGLDGQARALARQLAAHGWRARIVTRKDSDIQLPEPEIEVVRVERLDEDELRRIEAGEAQAFLSLLSDEDSLVVSELGYRVFGTRNIIVRSADREIWPRYEEIGVRVVDPHVALVSLLDQFVRSPMAASLMLGMDPGQEVLTVEVQNPDLDGVALRDLALPHDTLVIAVQRGAANLISHGYTRLAPGDVVTLVGSPESTERVAAQMAS